MLKIKDNYFVITTLVMTSILQVIIVLVPNMAKVFELKTIPLTDMLSLLLLTLPVLLTMEIYKVFIRARDGKRRYHKP